MSHSHVNAAVKEPRAAIAEDRAAKSEAMERAMLATQPLSSSRHGELCELGDRMIRTGWRRKLALGLLRKALGPGANG